jgi:hypothetical protein
VRAEARRHAASDHFENSADGIAGAQRMIDFGFHLSFGVKIYAAKRRFEIFADRNDFVPGSLAFQTRVADSDRVAQNRDPEFTEQELSQRTHRYARGGFACRSTFKDVPRVVEVKLQRPGQIGVAGTRRSEPPLSVLPALDLFDRKRTLPIFPVAIFDAQSDRRANCLAMPDAGEKFSLVFFYALPAAAAIAELATVEFAADELQIDGHTCGKA